MEACKIWEMEEIPMKSRVSMKKTGKVCQIHFFGLGGESTKKQLVETRETEKHKPWESKSVNYTIIPEEAVELCQLVLTLRHILDVDRYRNLKYLWKQAEMSVKTLKFFNLKENEGQSLPRAKGLLWIVKN